MKIIVAALVTFLNIALSLFVAYQSITLIGKLGVAQWVGTTLPILPFLLVAIYGLKPGSRGLWNAAFSLNALVLLICIAANIVEFGAGSPGLFAVWSVTVVMALFSGINLAVLLSFPPRRRSEPAVDESSLRRQP